MASIFKPKRSNVVGRVPTTADLVEGEIGVNIPDSKIYINTGGVISVSMGSTLTSTLKPGRYVYDVVITSGANVPTRVLEGQLEITPSVTRDYT